jgi:pimeloyl-ACP methyl ester carboxylesterase
VTVSAMPRSDEVVSLRDGRTLAFAEWGSPGGRPVVALYGTPGSRLFCPDVEATVEADVRLITVDRPGYGRSTPAPTLTIESVAADLRELHRLLGLPPCPFFGWSGGGPYALGVGAFASEIVTTVGVAASWGPLRDVPGVWKALPADLRDLMELAARDRGVALEAVTERCRWYAEQPERVLDDPPIPGNPDEDLHADAVVNRSMRVWFREGARHGARGYVDDWIATYARPWGFDLSAIDRRVMLWWGDGDVVCAREHTMYLAETIPGARLVVFPGEGHLAPVAHWDEILDELR